MRIKPLALIGLLPALLLGCAEPERPGWLSLQPNNWSNRSITDEPMIIEVAGPIAIDVQNFNGDVVIRGNPELTHAQVTVKREAVHGHGRVDEAIASLERISFTADVAPGQLGQLLQVRATTTDQEPHFQRAHIFIEAPDIENIFVRTSNGRVWAKNISGRIDVATTEKDVRIMTNQALRQPITIVNKNADIVLRMRGESTGRIDAQTVQGRANGFARYGRLIIAPTSRNDTFHATLNNGDNPITLRTVRGDITVSVVHNPEDVDVNPFP